MMSQQDNFSRKNVYTGLEEANKKWYSHWGCGKIFCNYGVQEALTLLFVIS